MKIQIIITFFNIFDISINHYELCCAPLDVMCNFKHILFEHCIIACHVTSASFLLALLAQFFPPHLQPTGGRASCLYL